MIIDRLANKASKSPGPVESKPRERIEPFSMSFNAICSQKKHTNIHFQFQRIRFSFLHNWT